MPPRLRGQALAEFALVAPLFCLLLLAVFDVGRGAYAGMVLANATREGARYAAAHQGQATWAADTAQAVRNYASGLPGQQITVSTSTQTTGGLTYVTVATSYPFTAIVPGVAYLLAASTLNSTSTSLAG
jgi:Flp pilus assembly protein TadG